MEILVTGFDPFDGEPINPAWEAVKRLDGKVIDGQHPVHALMIPTVRYEALSAIKRGIERFDPQLMIAVGQAGGRMAITPERVAINCDDFRIPDNKGNQPIDEMIVPDGPAAFFFNSSHQAHRNAAYGSGNPCSGIKLGWNLCL